VHSAAIAPVWFGGRLQGALAITHRGHFPPLDAHGLDRLGDVAELVGQALAHAAGRQLSAADPQPQIDSGTVSDIPTGWRASASRWRAGSSRCRRPSARSRVRW
jgi:hypothetical protein